MCRGLATMTRMRALRKPYYVPALGAHTVAGYSGTPLVRKLGIREGSTVAVIDAPRDYTAALGELPADVELVEDPASFQERHAVTLWFVRDPRAYQAGLQRIQKMADRTKLWVVWRKGSTNGLTQYVVRDAAIEAGLVDYKICAVNEQWSAMAFARRKS